jgi:pimeloyl-ACP methyl ester carboxylesterase
MRARSIRLALALTLLSAQAQQGVAQEPPPTPPADWGAMSINLEDVPYPHPVSFFSFALEGQDVRMAFMDVAPGSPANGKTVVLLHGMNFFAEVWASTIDVLRKAGYRTIAIDQIGFGRSSKPILAYSISLHAANTRRLLDHLGVKRVDVVAHSMGGMVASRFASSYPDLVENLVMINQIGLTDARASRPWRDTREVYAASLARDYPEILRGMRAYYVTWKPEYMKYVKIHYGWTRSGDWPRLAMVRALQQQAIYADPVVDDWPRI